MITGDIPEWTEQFSDTVMVTGASENHGYGSFNCLYSMVLADPYASYVYADLGLERMRVQKLFAHFETIHQIQEKMNSNGFIAYRVYAWDNYPVWMNLTGNRVQRGGYTWKAIPFVDVALRWKAVTLWQDGGNVIRDGISRELTSARHYGMYTAASGGNTKKWVYPDTLKFMVDHHMIPNIVLGAGMGAGNHIIVDAMNKTIYNQFLIPYKECLFTQKCVTPRGSDMTNHRQDQAVLSVFVHGLHVPRASNGRTFFSPALREERGNKERATITILNNLLLNIQNTYSIHITNKYYNTTGLHYTKQNYRFRSRPIDEEWPLENWSCLF